MTHSPEPINRDGNGTKAGSGTVGGPETAGRTNSKIPPGRKILQPYPGLRSFRQDEAARFFGREIQARQLRDILAERNLVVVARRLRLWKVFPGAGRAVTEAEQHRTDTETFWRLVRR